MDVVTVEIRDDASDALAASLKATEADLLSAGQALAATLLGRARDLADGTMLKVHSGAYIAGLQTSVHAGDHRVTVTLSDSDPVARYLEHGAEIPAHEILPDAAQALAFLGGGTATVFAKAVHDPGGAIGPHPVLETALADTEPAIVAQLTAAGLRFGGSL